MNKQQLAAKIWKAANGMRSKIEASEYKDYILGFIFYKFVSENEERYFREQEATVEEIKEISEDSSYAETTKRNIGYFIHYNNLFSTWLKKGDDFSVDDVITALNAFSRLNYMSYNAEKNRNEKTIYYNIFHTLETGLSKLGENSSKQTTAIKELIQIIKEIPIDDKDGYDVLGFIYEYLISNFAANAGKKAGEFYTPHEVSLLMSEIIADHLKDCREIKIYDPTSGSGSLLINIGGAVAKHISGRDKIKYYAQELKENTYNLTRMNLIMRGITPANITVRCDDTLGRDWPLFDESDPDGTYEPLCNLDAVVSNPPYSQKWDPTNKENDPRFADYGVAPKTKADYAFLLHDLYHLDVNGIMTIVLPHGVLFRGGEEEKIRKNLIEKNNIDAIIGLPANIFFGTGIPTIIMVLKKGTSRNDLDDILIIDASKGFEKDGKNNKLRSRDIKKIVDTYIARQETPKFSRRVSRQEIRENNWNLNIPRYVDSSDKAESFDLYATMSGGIPTAEIDELDDYFAVFKSLKDELFDFSNLHYAQLKVNDIKAVVENNEGVKSFKQCFVDAFDDFADDLYERLIEKVLTLSITSEENNIANDIFSRLNCVPLVDRYESYQTFSDNWKQISIDLEIIQTEGFEATKNVDPKMVQKTVNGQDTEVQDGWAGHVIPFDIVQASLLKEQTDELNKLNNSYNQIEQNLSDLIELLPEDEKESKLLNDDNTSFVEKEVNARVNDVKAEINTPEINTIRNYLTFSKKNDKLKYISEHPEIKWTAVSSNKDGTYGKSAIEKLLTLEIAKIDFDDDTVEAVLLKAQQLLVQQKELKKLIKEQTANLEAMTKAAIENLTDDQAKDMLYLKWIKPLVDGIAVLPDSIVSALTNKINTLTKKYSVTLLDVEAQIDETEKAFADMIDDLEGNEFDMKGLKELQKLLKGE